MAAHLTRHARRMAELGYDPHDQEGAERVGLPVPRGGDTAAAQYYGAARYWERVARELVELAEYDALSGCERCIPIEQRARFFQRLAEDRQRRLEAAERVELLTRQSCREREQAERATAGALVDTMRKSLRDAVEDRDAFGKENERLLQQLADTRDAHARKCAQSDTFRQQRDEERERAATAIRRRNFLAAGLAGALTLAAYLALMAPVSF